MSKSIESSFGVYLAEYIMSHCIPSLSCNQSTSRVIQVTPEEASEYKRLDDVWFSKVMIEDTKLKEKVLINTEEGDYKLSEDEWNARMKYAYMLKEKYLPHKLKCSIPYIDFSNEKVNKEIKKGLITSLWNWDFCEWSLKEGDILFENEVDRYGPNDKYSAHLSYVTLKLELEPPSSYTGKDWIEIKTKQKDI